MDPAADTESAASIPPDRSRHIERCIPELGRCEFDWRVRIDGQCHEISSS